MTLLTWPIFWFVCIAFVVVEALLIGSAVRLRRKAANSDAPRLSGGRYNLFWTMLPALLVVILLVLVFQAITGSSQVLL